MTHRNERASILVLFAVCLTLIMVSLAMTLDIGWILLTRGQLQNAADSAALASVIELVDEDILTGSPDQADDVIAARDIAETYASFNKAAHTYLAIDRNDQNHIDGGVVIGYIDDPLNPSSPFLTNGVSTFNTIQVEARRSQALNGPLGLFVGNFTGVQSVELAARSSATIDNRVIGFDVRQNGGGIGSEGGSEGGGEGGSGDRMVDLLPFTVYVYAWNSAYPHRHTLLPGNECDVEKLIRDNYSYNEISKQVTGGSDGIDEFRMYPNKGGICASPGAPGNFGTIDIGNASNSTSDIDRQIRYGISSSDLLAIGGMIMTEGDDGIFYKWLNGDTGVSTSIRDALEDIKGKPRILPLYRNMYGQGNTVMYEIVEFVPVRVMNVHMTGNLENRYIAVQPLKVVSSNAVIHPNGPPSEYLYAMSITE